MIITKFETWWVERCRCLFDEKRQGGAKMGWDVLVLKLTTDTGIEGMLIKGVASGVKYSRGEENNLFIAF